MVPINAMIADITSALPPPVRTAMLGRSATGVVGFIFAAELAVEAKMAVDNIPPIVRPICLPVATAAEPFPRSSLGTLLMIPLPFAGSNIAVPAPAKRKQIHKITSFPSAIVKPMMYKPSPNENNPRSMRAGLPNLSERIPMAGEIGNLIPWYKPINKPALDAENPSPLMSKNGDIEFSVLTAMYKVTNVNIPME